MKRALSAVALLVIAGVACSIASPPQIIVVTATPNPALMANNTQVPTVAPTQTPFVVTATPVPASPTPSAPTYTGTVPVNCRAEPWVTNTWNDNRVSFVNTAQTVQIYGKSPVKFGLWYLVQVGSNRCWVFWQYGTLAGDIASVQEIPIYVVPAPFRPERFNLKIENNQGEPICFVNLKLEDEDWREIETSDFNDGDRRTFKRLEPGFYKFRIYNCAHNILDTGSFTLDDNMTLDTP